MPETLDITGRHALANVFTELGVTVEVLADGSAQLDEAALHALLEQLNRTDQVRKVAFGPDTAALETVEKISSGSCEGNLSVLDLAAEYDAVALINGVAIPAAGVLKVVIDLDLAARISSLLDDRDPADALEELRFLLVAGERSDVANLGEYVAGAAELLAV